MKKKLTQAFFEYRKWLLINIMRTFIFLLCTTAALGFSSNNVLSQNSKVKIDTDKTVSVDEVFKIISDQTDYKFIYQSNLFENFPKVNLKKGTIKANKLLKMSFLKGPFNFSFSNENTIVITENPNRLEITEKVVYIIGKVTDESGEGVPGVNIYEKGNNLNGVISDVGGAYSIQVESQESILVYSFIGTVTQERVVGTQQIIDVQLIEETKGLNEVVVTGYQSIQEGRATGSYKIVDSDDLDQIESLSIEEKLEGQSSGLYVRGGNEIIIRGINTFRGDKKPLYVIDGVPFSDNDDFILNNDDIETISVLKDATSASIWGIRSSNGVIVITTKKAKANAPMEVNFKHSSRFISKLDYDDLNNLSASEHVDLLSDFYTHNPRATGSQTYDNVGKVYVGLQNGIISEEQALDQINEIKKHDNRDEVMKNFYRRSRILQNTLSVKYSTDNLRSYSSINFIDNKSQQIGDENKTYNLLSNNDFIFNKKLTFNLNVKGSYDKGKNNATFANLMGYERLFDDSGNYMHEIGGNGIKQGYQDQLSNYGFRDWTYNRVRQRKMNDKESVSHKINSSLSLLYKPIESVTLRTNFNYGFNNTTATEYYSPEHYEVRNLINLFSEVKGTDFSMPPPFVHDPTIIAHHYPTEGGIFKEAINQSLSYSWRNTIDFNKIFGDFYIQAIVGSEILQYRTKTTANELHGYNKDSYSNEQVNWTALNEGVDGYGKGRMGIEAIRQSLRKNEFHREHLDRYTSWFGTTTFSYLDRYTLFGSYRLDKANLLVTNDKYRSNPTWSLGARWNLKDEGISFLNSFQSFNIKASYGLSGLLIKEFLPNITGFYRNEFITGNKVFIASNPENKDLSWEKTKSFNVGLSFSLQNNISADIEYYQDKSDKILSLVNINPTYGWEQINANAANVTNSGIDISLKYRFKKKDWRWNTGLNFSFTTNKIDKANFKINRNDINKPNDTFVEGESIGSIFAVDFRLDENGKGVLKSAKDGEEYESAKIRDFEIEDYKFAGKLDPPIFGSWSNTIAYKKWSMSIFMTYKFGHKIKLPFANPYSIRQEIPSKWTSEKYRWKKAGDEKHTFVPNLDFSDRSNQSEYQAYGEGMHLIDKGDIVRLRSVNFAYDISDYSKLIKRGSSIKLTAQNLWYWAANKEGLDSDAISGFSPPKEFILSVNLTF